MHLMVINHTIFITIRGSMSDKVNAKSFSAEVTDRLLKQIKLRPARILVS